MSFQIAIVIFLLSSNKCKFLMASHFLWFPPVFLWIVRSLGPSHEDQVRSIWIISMIKDSKRLCRPFSEKSLLVDIVLSYVVFHCELNWNSQRGKVHFKPPVEFWMMWCRLGFFSSSTIDDPVSLLHSGACFSRINEKISPFEWGN